MRLTELEPTFVKRISDHEFFTVENLILADGICFLCPKCFQEKGDSKGVHSIICWAPNVPQTTSPTPGRWEMLGTGFEDLELKAGSSSVLLDGGCRAHFFIRNGEVLFT